MALDRLILILDHQEAQVIIDALEDYAETLHKMADSPDYGSDEDAARWTEKAEKIEALALTVERERIASGGLV